MGDVQSPRCCRAASSDPGGHPGRGEAPSWGSRGGPGRGREVAVGRTEWTEGVRSEEKSCGLEAGAGSGPGAASGLASLRAAAGEGSSAEAGGPRRAPRLHSPRAGLQGARLFRSFEKLSYFIRRGGHHRLCCISTVTLLLSKSHVEFGLSGLRGYGSIASVQSRCR